VATEALRDDRGGAAADERIQDDAAPGTAGQDADLNQFFGEHGKVRIA
jgi:hypothetical protein